MKSKDQILLEAAYKQISRDESQIEQLNEFNLSKLNPFTKKQTAQQPSSTAQQPSSTAQQPSSTAQQPSSTAQNKGEQQAVAAAFDIASTKISEVFKQHQLANSPLFADLWKTIMNWRHKNIH
jgi:prophage maintenance system killer protein